MREVLFQHFGAPAFFPTSSCCCCFSILVILASARNSAKSCLALSCTSPLHSALSVSRKGRGEDITVFQNPVPNSKRGAVIRSKVGGNSFQANYRPPSGRITAHVRANYRPPSRGDSRGVAVAPIGAAGYNPGLWSDLPTIIRAPPASPTASAVRQHSPDVLGPAARRRAWCAY